MTQPISHFQKRNVKLSDKRTSLVLDSYHWAQLDQILINESVEFDMLIQDIELRRSNLSLASACRIFILMYMHYRLETRANHLSQTQDWQTGTDEDATSMFMLGEPEAKQPSALFQALSLLSRYVAQAS